MAYCVKCGTMVGDDVPLLLRLAKHLVNLRPMQEKLAYPEGIFVENIPLLIRANVHKYKDGYYEMQGERTGRCYKLGQEVYVRVLGADRMLR